MPKMLYISLARFPTEKAHGLQIAQNCEAFADAGYDVELWVSTRGTNVDIATTNIYQHYGVKENFAFDRVPSINLYRFAQNNQKLEYIAFWVHILTYCLMLFWKLIGKQADVYYTRDRYIVMALSLIIPREKIAFEVHQFAPTSKGQAAQRASAKRTAHLITITPKLRDDFVTHHHTDPSEILVAHDGIRAERFQNLLERADARDLIGWDTSAFVVGYMGRLHTMGMDKGVGLLVDAVAPIKDVSLALVGGPEDMAAQLGVQYSEKGGKSEQFINAGTVQPDMIPTYLAAFDICVMPFPWTTHYAYYMSPLKLFEYMASGAPILATDLPSVVDVVTHGETAYIVPPDDVNALHEAIITLKNDPDLRQTLAHNARELVTSHYTWAARAEHIKTHIERAIL